MAVAFTSFAFDSSAENGGHGVKIGLYRVQAAQLHNVTFVRVESMKMAIVDTMAA
jgi:hypothetical protein